MNLTDDFILKCQKGTTILFDDICALFPPRLGEVVDLDYSKFNQYTQIILMEKPDLEKNPENEEMIKLLKELNDFQYFLLLTTMDKEFNELAKQAFHFFTHEKVSFSIDPAQIIIGPLDEKHIINEESFIAFRAAIRKICFININDDSDEIIINPDDSPKLKAMKKKMIENRKKVAKAKANKRKQEAGGDINFSDLVGSVALAVPGLNMDNIWNITYYSFQDQLKRMGWQEEYKTNTRAALAGAKIDKSKLKYWIRSIKSSDDNTK